ncbi:hypothetical protein CGLO_18124 [Colletotrichum gloeosporioides Cg-14]|uniref:Uncharacterized protein n=1 Tax=Colletotrichum gloeosporioides (strain Cg-14) TaxID=1237896 RepID=T0L4R6_COLGC|nr:hypothetical protein CGLO_18124 [Colletotrichum gloeosporioides Cg-14]
MSRLSSFLSDDCTNLLIC